MCQEECDQLQYSKMFGFIFASFKKGSKQATLNLVTELDDLWGVVTQRETC